MTLKIVFAAAMAMVTADSAFSQSQSEPAQTYTPADFDQFAPRTALDMVVRVPGFRLENVDNNNRGLGQASGNVLINGQRLSGKSNSPRDALGRIPATNVERIELLDGATLDIPGLSGQVVNVVAKSSGISGAWTYRARWREDLPPAYDWIEGSLSGEIGALSWTLGIENETFRGGASGQERVLDGQRALTETRNESVNFIGALTSLSGSLEWTPANGDIANLNADLNQYDAFERETSVRMPIDGVDRRRLFRFAEDEWNTEVGGDYERGVGPGRLKAIGLYRFEHSPFTNTLFEGAVDGSSSLNAGFEQTIDESESILRTEYGWSPNDGTDWQVALEGAFNTLEAETRSQFLDDGTPVDLSELPFDRTRVEERRMEGSATWSKTLTERLSVQASLGAEYSELSSGDLLREFTRPKGFLSATWAQDEDTTWTARIEREVGQLNFFDFVSSANINIETEDRGNPDIVPQQSWLGEIEYERDLGNFGAATIRAYGSLIEDVVDRIPIGETGEGPGNLDSATQYGIDIDTTFELGPLGLDGMRWDVELELRQSSIDDPLTGESRRINEDLVLGLFTEFRHDIPNTDWAWGIALERFDRAPVFRLDQRQYFEARPGFGFGFIEHKDVYGLTATVLLANLFDQDDQFTREVFTPRRTGDLLFVEDRTRNFGPILTFRLKGSF